MIKVKLKHSSVEVDRVYSMLIENAIQVVKTSDWGDVTTCIFNTQDELQKIALLLNRGTRFGVSIKSQREIFTFKDFINWWRN